MDDFRRQALAILNQDRIWAAYAIADLQPAYAADCVWALRDGAEGSAAALLYYGLPTPVLFTCGAEAALAAALAAWAAAGQLPPRVDLAVREEHEAVVGRWFDGAAGRKPMLRMWLADSGRVLAASGGVRRLAAADAPGIQALYAHGGPFTPDAFMPEQVAQGVFFGVEDDAGALVAVGGTHLWDAGERIAAIGNMYTHPAHRGRGLAALVLAAIVRTLLGAGVATIVLNVNQHNPAAQRLYTRFGFVTHCPFIEGVAVNIQSGE